MKTHRAFPWRLLESSAAFVFWFQATRVFFSSLFGVIYDVVFDGDIPYSYAAIVVLLILLALTVPAVFSLKSIKKVALDNKLYDGLFITICIAAIVRIALAANNPGIRLYSSIIVIAFINIYFVLIIKKQFDLFPVAAVLGLVSDQIMRACGFTWDITLQPGHIFILIATSLIVVASAWSARCRYEADKNISSFSGKLGWDGGLAFGALLFLESAILAQPNVISRWTGIQYEFSAPLLILFTALPLVTLGKKLNDFGGTILKVFERQGVLIRTCILIFGVLPGLGNWIPGPITFTWLLIAQFLLILTLPMLFLRSDNADENSGVSIALGMLIFLIINLAFAFAFTYPYTIPSFRNSGRMIIIIAAILAIFPIAYKPPKFKSTGPVPINNTMVTIVLFVFVATLLGSKPELIPKNEADKTIVAATYNIHYGYDTRWKYSLAGQAEAIEKSGADIVFLQEVDAGRITSMSVDNALWLADRLGMHAVFAPALEGLSGVALLSRLPVLDSEWQLLPSELEQTAIVHARLQWADTELDAFGVWLGLEQQERINQVTAALEIIGDSNLVILGGDMNCEPLTREYLAIGEKGFIDPFVETGNINAYSDPAIQPTKRIDYIWVRGASSTHSWVSSSLASDHRLVAASLVME